MMEEVKCFGYFFAFGATGATLLGLPADPVTLSSMVGYGSLMMAYGAEAVAGWRR